MNLPCVLLLDNTLSRMMSDELVALPLLDTANDDAWSLVSITLPLAYLLVLWSLSVSTAEEGVVCIIRQPSPT